MPTISVVVSENYFPPLTASSDVTKVGVLGKLTDTRMVVVPSPARTVWVQIPRGANYFRSGIRKLFSTAYTVMVSSTGAILMESIKLIITHNVDAQLSYRTGVGSNLTRIRK